MKTCGNCGTTDLNCIHDGEYADMPMPCADLWTPVPVMVPDMPNIPPPPPKLEPTELERAQWWWCGWIRASARSKRPTEDRGIRRIERLYDAIRAQARKGQTT